MADAGKVDLRQSDFQSIGAFFFRYRTTIYPIVMISLFLGFKPVFPAGQEWLDNWLDALGLLVAFTGQVLRAATIGYAYIIRGGRNKKAYAEDLVTAGLFAHSRNPLYLGNILICSGLFLIHGNPSVVVLGISFFIFFYSAIVSSEESYLLEKFGSEFEAYRDEVNRWLPRLRGLRESVRDMKFRWARLVVKEYGSTYSWVGTSLFLLGYDTLSHFPYSQRSRSVNALGILFAIATLAWAFARYLKLSRKLQAD